MVEIATIGGMDFVVDAIPASLQDLPGVYVLLRTEGDQCTILYVGETDNLKHQLTENLEEHEVYDSAILQAKANRLATKPLTVGKRARQDIVSRLNNQYEPVFGR